MTPLTIDVANAPRVGLTEAKANLSGIVSHAEQTGEAHVIMRYGKPVAAIVPLPQAKAPAGRARGSLSAYASSARIELEDGAFARAMAVKHGDLA